MVNQQEQELIEQLKSDKKSLVIQAIVKLTRSGKSKEALEALIPFTSVKDRELSYFSLQAAEKIATKNNIKLESLLEQDKVQDSTISLTRQKLLNPERKEIQNIKTEIRKLEFNIPPELLPAVAVFLAKNGDIEDAPLVEHYLLKEKSNLVLPFIETAEKIAPSILPRTLPSLLASGQPLVRSRSISSLRRIDPQEADRHFSDLLASRNPEDRLAGIAIAFIFPFKRVKGYILSMLQEEQDKDVLKACQTFLASNPELDSALTMLDNIDAAPAAQKSSLTLIFKTICQAMATAGILPPEKAAPQEIVKLWKKQRLESFLNNLEIQLAFSDETRKKSIIAWIEKNRSHPKVKELIERLAHNPQTEKVFLYLTSPGKQSSDEKSETDNEDGSKKKDTDETREKIKKMRSLDLDNFSQNKSWLLDLAQNGPVKLRKEAISTLLRLHPDNKLLDIAKATINEANPILKTVSFQVLERLDQNFLKESIELFLQEDNAALRVRAVRFALKFKKEKAIEILRKLLKSNEHRIRANAVACLGLCPFESVYKLIMEQLDSEDHPVIAKHLTSILLNNPSRRVLKGIDNITRTSNPAVSMVVSQARNDLFEIISELPEDQLEKEIQPEPETNSKPYSIQNVRSLANKNRKEWKPAYKPDKKAEIKKAIKENFNWPMALSGAILFVFLGMLPIMFLKHKGSNYDLKTQQTKDWRDSERKNFTSSEIPENFRMNKSCSIATEVEKVTSDTSMVVAHDDRKIMVKFDKPLLKHVSKGTQMIVTMVPYRVKSNGIIQAKGINIAISKGQIK
ncbi:MAG: HEAT repeat domain-containing protein [Candidatus Rifleibacteriota bacterium]